MMKRHALMLARCWDCWSPPRPGQPADRRPRVLCPSSMAKTCPAGKCPTAITATGRSSTASSITMPAARPRETNRSGATASIGDFVLQFDWRLKEAPFINKNVPYILPDGTHAKDINGKELQLALPDADSGVYLARRRLLSGRISGAGRSARARCTASAWTARRRPSSAPPSRRAPRPTSRSASGTISRSPSEARPSTSCLNGKTVIPGATIPDLPDRGRLAFQHHGGKNKDGDWTGPPSLVQFKNIYIKELPANARRATPSADAVRALLITGGHDHEASFYTLFDGYKDLARMPVATSATAFQNDLRGKYDVVIMYDFSRDLDENGKKNLRDFVESGKGVVVLHHALLNYQKWTWWYRGRGRRQLSPAARGGHPVVDRQERPGDLRHAGRAASDHRGDRAVSHRGRNLQDGCGFRPRSGRC